MYQVLIWTALVILKILFQKPNIGVYFLHLCGHMTQTLISDLQLQLLYDKTHIE